MSNMFSESSSSSESEQARIRALEQACERCEAEVLRYHEREDKWREEKAVLSQQLSVCQQELVEWKGISENVTHAYECCETGRNALAEKWQAAEAKLAVCQQERDEIRRKAEGDVKALALRLREAIEPLKRSDDPEEAEAIRHTPDYVLMTRKAFEQENELHRKRLREAEQERDSLRLELAASEHNRIKGNEESALRLREAFEAGIVHVLQRKMEDDRYARAWLSVAKTEVDEAFAKYCLIRAERDRMTATPTIGGKDETCDTESSHTLDSRDAASRLREAERAAFEAGIGYGRLSYGLYPDGPTVQDAFDDYSRSLVAPPPTVEVNHEKDTKKSDPGTV